VDLLYFVDYDERPFSARIAYNSFVANIDRTAISKCKFHGQSSFSLRDENYVHVSRLGN